MRLLEADAELRGSDLSWPELHAWMRQPLQPMLPGKGRRIKRSLPGQVASLQGKMNRWGTLIYNLGQRRRVCLLRTEVQQGSESGDEKIKLHLTVKEHIF